MEEEVKAILMRTLEVLRDRTTIHGQDRNDNEVISLIDDIEIELGINSCDGCEDPQCKDCSFDY